MFKINRLLSVAILLFLVLGVWNCGGGGGGDGSSGGSGGTINLMQGSVPPPDTISKTVTMQYATEDGTQVDIEAVEGWVVIQFDSTITENIAESLITNNGGSVVSKVPATGYYLISVTPNNEMNFINKMRQEPTVVYAEPDYLTGRRGTPNEWDNISEYDYRRQPFHKIKAPEAWNLLLSSSTTMLREKEIGIVDAFSGLEDGYFDFGDRLQNKPFLTWPSNHGTKIVALCCAGGNNTYGNVGVNWWSKIRLGGLIINHRFLIITKLQELINDGATVINLSVGYVNDENGSCSGKEKNNYKSDYKHLFQTIMEIRKKKSDFLIVIAAGNDNCELNQIDIPNKPDNVIIVGAIGPLDTKIDSNWGTSVDITAPDSMDWYNYSTNSVETVGGGTSFAAPLVSGAAALVWAKEPGLKPQEVIQRLKSTAKGNIPEFGNAGILDVFKALNGGDFLTSSNATKAGGALVRAFAIRGPIGSTGSSTKASAVADSNSSSSLSDILHTALSVYNETYYRESQTGLRKSSSVNCSGGGNINISVSDTVSDATYPIDAIATYNSCRMGTVTMNGSANIHMESSTKFTFSASSLTYTDTAANTNYTFTNTTIDFDFTTGNQITGLSATITGDISGTDGGKSINYQFDKFKMTTNSSSSGSTIQISGRFKDSCLGGWLTVATNTPVFLPSNATCPTAGELIATSGENSIKVSIAQDSKITIYYNNNLVQTYSNCTEVSNLCSS